MVVGRHSEALALEKELRSKIKYEDSGQCSDFALARQDEMTQAARLAGAPSLPPKPAVRSFCASGRKMLNVDPRPGWLWNSSQPPITPASCFASVNPMPIPPD